MKVTLLARALLAITCAITPAALAQPANDLCANATEIVDSAVAIFINYDTTTAVNNHSGSCGCTSGHDVWYRYIPSTSGQLSLSTVGLAAWDTSISVFTGTCAALAPVPGGCNDDASNGGLQSAVTISVTAGTQYIIKLSGCGFGPATLRVTTPTFTNFATPSNSLTFQGQLRDDSGALINGFVTLRLTLLNTRTWVPVSTTIFSSTLVDGLITANLPIGGTINSNDPYAIFISVNNTTLSQSFPVNRILQARFAETAALAGPWALSGTTVSYSGGPVGVGVATPQSGSSLHVLAGAGIAASNPDVIFGSATTTQLRFDNNEVQAVSSPGTGTSLYLNFSGGPIVMGGASGSNTSLSLNGDAFKPGGGSWSFLSDARLKHDVLPMKDSLEKLLSLRGVTFEYNDPEALHELPGTKLGVVAQDVESVFPDWVSTNKDGFKYVTFRGFEALTVEALRDLRAEKDAAIQQLQNENALLRERLERIEKLLSEPK